MTLFDYIASQPADARQANNWLACSKRNIATRIRNGTFNESLALRLLTNNARDYAKTRSAPYTARQLENCASQLLATITE
jgi:hypothetical protein